MTEIPYILDISWLIYILFLNLSLKFLFLLYFRILLRLFLSNPKLLQSIYFVLILIKNHWLLFFWAQQIEMTTLLLKPLMSGNFQSPPPPGTESILLFIFLRISFLESKRFTICYKLWNWQVSFFGQRRSGFWFENNVFWNLIKALFSFARETYWNVAESNWFRCLCVWKCLASKLLSD